MSEIVNLNTKRKELEQEKENDVVYERNCKFKY